MVKEILRRGQERALAIALRKMRDVREVIGLTTRYSFSSSMAKNKINIGSPIPPSSKTMDGHGGSGMTISIDDFAHVELRVGKVVEAKNKEGSERLIRLVVDIGEEKSRIIFTGVRPFGYQPSDFAGKQFLFITNLAPRKMLDEESQGMILAVDGPSTGSGLNKPIFVSAEGMPIGAKIR